MRCDSLQALEHFESFNPDSPQGKKVLRQECAPDAVSMEYSTRSAVSCCGAMQQSLGTALGLVGRRDPAIRVHDHEVVRTEMAFVLAACCNQDSHRISIEHNAVIAGGA